MASPLLESKLYVPAPRGALVPRGRLSARLDRGTKGRLTLVAAPAGFGKTTVLVVWLAQADQSAAWLSLDHRDNHPKSFWAYLIAALQTLAPGVGDDALVLLQSSQPPTIEAILATLLNDLNAIARDVVVVLDDYHVIDARDIHEGMVFLLDHLPQRVHLVIASRADPPWPLARLRARGDLAEIRAADLRFTADETAAFLNQAMGLDLSVGDVTALEARTEGWIVGLQLAALSLQGRADVSGFVQAFAGDDRYVLDYLVDEVLGRQPEPIRRFLLHTAVLDRLSGPLCDAVTGRGDSQRVLDGLERDNLFVVALDDKRHWYRYHHLFADVLHVRLLAEHPDHVPILRRRASQWYELHGIPAEAIRHALAAKDVERAADLIERAMPAMLKSRQEATIRDWIHEIPEDLVRVRPVLNVGFVAALVSGGDFDGIEERLRDAEQWLDTTGGRQRSAGGPADVVVVDHQGFEHLPGQIELYRTAQSLVRGDVPATVRHARRTIERSARDDHVTPAGATAMLGLVSWASGDLEAAHSAYAECIAGLQRAGHVSDVLGCTIALGDIRMAQGRLGDAWHTYERALQRVAGHDGPVVRGTADMHVGMSEVHRERGDLEAASQDLRRSQSLGEDTGLPQNPYRWRVAEARIRQSEGDLRGAADLLDEAERVYVGDFFPNVRPIPALRARVLVMQGDLVAALEWVRGQGLSHDDGLSYLREFEHITLARVLVAQSVVERATSALHDATQLLSRLLTAAEHGGRTRSVVEILALRALAHQTLGDIPAALACLQRAAALAEPEGYIQVFLDEGPPMRVLLREAAKRGITSNHVRRLATACRIGTDVSVASQGLVEPLSGRELEVLRLLDTSMSVPEIARELFVSPNTLRTHTRHIFAKLEVHNRRAAVDRAGELGLL